MEGWELDWTLLGTRTGLTALEFKLGLVIVTELTGTSFPQGLELILSWALWLELLSQEQIQEVFSGAGS